MGVAIKIDSFDLHTIFENLTFYGEMNNEFILS